MTPLSPQDLVPFDSFTSSHPLKVDLVYAKPAHPDNLFKTGIYRPDARMWGHRSLVDIVLDAANICYKRTGWTFEVKDCLRTVEAQALMAETPIVKANPHWLQEPRLLSPPGAGGHPRGMAVDIVLLDKNGDEVDMGTRFDYLTEDRSNNPAARAYKNFSPAVLENRLALESAMLEAAALHGRRLLPLPQEWWDFRFYPEETKILAPYHDAELPPGMRMTA